MYLNIEFPDHTNISVHGTYEEVKNELNKWKDKFKLIIFHQMESVEFEGFMVYARNN